MALPLVKRLGDIGIITDVAPFDLPPNALSQGSNIRCVDGKIKRAPIFKSVLATTVDTPVFTWVYAKPGDDERIGIADKDGTLYFYDSGGEEDVTPVGFVTGDSDSPHTDCTLANVNYINRDTAVPMYYNNASTDFDELTNWNANWRCRALRSFKDALIAINMTESGVAYPNKIRASEFAEIDTVPSTWDETDPENNAYSNVINECKSELLDGCQLGDIFVLASKEQAFMMQYTADTDIYQIRPLWNKGVIATNCMIEVEGKLYVFGDDDIYTTDGLLPTSIIAGRNKSFVFDNVLRAQINYCFVTFDKRNREIIFGYPSGDSYAAFVGVDYANRGAAYNIDNGTWTFRDLPNVGRPAWAELSQSETYDSISASLTYEDAGGSYASYEDSAQGVLFFPSTTSVPGGLTDSRLLGYDLPSEGVLTHEINSEATKKAWAQRIWMDLDEVEGINYGYKVFLKIYPQADSMQETGNFKFKFAGALYSDPNITLTWTALQSFDPQSTECLSVPKNPSTRVATGGRYLAWHVENSTNFGFELAGFDADIKTIGT